MEFHEVEMVGPLKTDNIRASDGTLAAIISDSTGNVNFQNDVEVSQDLDVDRDATIFRNLEVQGPLAEFIQDVQIGQDLDVGRDTDITRDLAVGRNAAVVQGLTVGNRVETTNLRMTGNGPAAGKVLVAGDGIGNLSYQYASVPTGQSILFYTNTAVLGYTILDISDDDVVYVTKGTVHGGQAGGVAKPGGSWSHRHGLGSITIPPHNHQWYDYIGSAIVESWQADGVTKTRWGQNRTSTTVGPMAAVTSAESQSVDTDDMYTKLSGATTGDAGDTEYNTTWRPKGRNFTLQQKN